MDQNKFNNIEELRAELSKRLKNKIENQEKLKTPNPPPRYDEIFWEGIEWLDKQ